MKIKNPIFTLKFSLLLSMIMDFGMHIDDGFNYK